jgi:hypothetical protein
MRALCLLLVAGCADDRAVEDSVRIDHGVYGQLSSDSDAGQTPSRAAPGWSIDVYRRGATALELVGSPVSDGNGVFQLALPPGAYELCAGGADPGDIYAQSAYECFGACTFLDVTAALARADWEGNVEGGWWSAGDHCP